MKPRVAVAMAVFDDSKYLRLSLDALCEQTFCDFHLTVLDDGSSDDSAAIAESYVGRLPLTVHRGPHRGRHDAKQESWRLAAPAAPYLLVLDSDMALPRDGIEKMVALLDSQSDVAAVSAQCRSEDTRPLGAAQAFLDDVFTDSNRDANGNARWIQGGSVMLRRSALEATTITGRLGEDNELSQQLSARWRLVNPRYLVATHYGVPTTLGGVAMRNYREGIRVRSLVRIYPHARQLGNVARLVPLPLAALAVVAIASGQFWGSAVAAGLLGAYTGAFLWASRRVAAPLSTRLSATALFAFGNIAFGAGYVREALRLRRAPMREPNRSY